MKMTVKKIAAVSVWGVYTAAYLSIAKQDIAGTSGNQAFFADTGNCFVSGLS